VPFGRERTLKWAFDITEIRIIQGVAELDHGTYRELHSSRRWRNNEPVDAYGHLTCLGWSNLPM